MVPLRLRSGTKLFAQCQPLWKEHKKYVAFLITLAASHGYSRRGVVCCVADKEASKMRKTLEDFYFGNITPSEQDMATGSELKQAVDRVARCEQQLTERLGEVEQVILNELVSAQHIANSITAVENFILGFRLGVRIMVECMDDNDGDIRSGDN